MKTAQETNTQVKEWVSGDDLTEVPQSKRYALRRYVPTGVYYLHVKICGKLYRESLQTQDKDKAIELRDKRIAEIKTELAQGIQNEDMTFDQLLNLTATELDRRERLPRGTPEALQSSAADSYRLSIRRLRQQTTLQGGKRVRPPFLCKEHLQTQIRLIKTEMLRKWLEPVAESLSGSSYNHMLQMLRSAFDMMVRAEKIGFNPVRELKRAKRRLTAKELPPESRLDELIDELRKQMRNAHRDESADVVFFLSRTGARIHETRSLRKSDVHFEATDKYPYGFIVFRENTTKNGDPKIIPMLPELVPVLRRRLKKNIGGEYVFTIKTARKSIAGACERLGFPRFTHHTFRHFFASIMLTRGYSYAEVAFLLGHKDKGKLLAEVYAHIMSDHFVQKFSQTKIGGSKEPLPQEPEAAKPELVLDDEELALILQMRKAKEQPQLGETT